MQAGESQAGTSKKPRLDRPGWPRQAIYQYPGCVIPLPYQGMDDEIMETRLKPRFSRWELNTYPIPGFS
ncbi:hypothetical protein SXCC_00395 [Gluconacetobacter sp. SXCC-1]|nr:hypothetical protein SXCC_00395 [Gluconacetobacter sp. SXCC-1]